MIPDRWDRPRKSGDTSGRSNAAGRPWRAPSDGVSSGSSRCSSRWDPGEQPDSLTQRPAAPECTPCCLSPSGSREPGMQPLASLTPSRHGDTTHECRWPLKVFPVFIYTFMDKMSRFIQCSVHKSSADARSKSFVRLSTRDCLVTYLFCSKLSWLHCLCTPFMKATLACISSVLKSSVSYKLT